MTTTYPIADMMIGVRNMIEAADLRRGDQVLLLADTRSDQPTLEALSTGLRFFGAEPMTLVTEPIAPTATCRKPCWKPCASRTWSSGCGRFSSLLLPRIAPWDASAKRAAASFMKAA